MKVLQAFLAFLFAAVGFAQNLQGVVLDAGNTPLPVRMFTLTIHPLPRLPTAKAILVSL
jgi:hypothetical protein